MKRASIRCYEGATIRTVSTAADQMDRTIRNREKDTKVKFDRMRSGQMANLGTGGSRLAF